MTCGARPPSPIGRCTTCTTSRTGRSGSMSRSCCSPSSEFSPSATPTEPARPPAATTMSALAPARLVLTARDYVAAHRYSVTLTFAAVTCALAPAYVVRWRFAFVPTTLLEIAILLTVAAFAVETARQRSSIAWKGPFTIPALVFILAGAISVVAAPDRRAAFGLYRAYFIEPIAFAVVVATIVDSNRRALLLLGGLATGGVVAGVPNPIVVLAALPAHTPDVSLTPPVG